MLKNKNYLKKNIEEKSVNTFQMNFKEVKVVDGKLKIKGFASTPDLDRYDDVIKPEAFANAMKTYMKNPVVLLGHDSDKPIGTVTEYNLDGKGLEVTVDLINDTDGCFEKIQNKTLRGFSIGWICNDCVFREEGTKFIREVISLDLVEISVVATPANPNTLFTLAKSLKKLFDKMGLEKKDSEEIIETAPEVTVETQEPEAQESETPEKKSEDTGEEVPPETVDTVEAPAVADATPEVVDPDKSDIVQADEIPAVVTGETTVDEVEALIEPMIADAVEKAVSHLIAQNVELKTALEALQVKITAVESDVCKIEVQPSRRSESKSVSRVLTYSML